MSSNKNYIGAGLIALALIGIWGWVIPEYNKITELGTAIGERQDLYDTRAAIVKRIQDLNKEYQQKASDVAKISAVLPSKKSLAEIISSLDKIALQSGLQLISASAVSKDDSSQNSVYNTLPVDLVANGGYTGLVSFLQSIEKNIRIMDIVSINAAALSGENTGSLNLTLRGNTYYLK